MITLEFENTTMQLPAWVKNQQCHYLSPLQEAELTGETQPLLSILPSLFFQNLMIPSKRTPILCFKLPASIYSLFIKHLWSTYLVPGTVQDTWDTEVKATDSRAGPRWIAHSAVLRKPLHHPHFVLSVFSYKLFFLLQLSILSISIFFGSL